jgi:hypothetical protein
MFGQLAQVRGVEPCALTGPASATPVTADPGTPTTSAPKNPATPPGTPDIACVQKAAGDVQKLQECLK